MKYIKYESLLIGIILIIAFLIRVYGINFGLPDLYHPDEVDKIVIAQHMFKTGDLNPHYFNKPTLFIYLNTLLYVPYYWMGKLWGVFHSPNDILSPIRLAMGVAHAPMPTTVLMGRLLTCVFGLASILMIFFIGKQLSKNNAVGLLAATMMAIAPVHVAQSRYIIENVFLVFFQAVVILASLRIVQRGKTSDYVLGGIAAGLAISSKYPGGLIAIVPLSAHFLHLPLKQGLKDAHIYLFLILIPIAFFMTTPYALFDHTKFLKDTLFEVDHYSTGHAGMEGKALLWYLSHAWETAGLIYLLALCEMVRGVYMRDKGILLLSLFPLVNFIFISCFVVRNDRTFLPLTPMLYVLAASFLAHLLIKAERNEGKGFKSFSVVGVVLLSAISIAQPMFKTIQDTIQLTTIDSRATSKIWINEHIPAGAKIAIESYAPFIDPSRFVIQAVRKMIEHEPEWYLEHNFDYLICSQGMYGRFYKEPDKYSQQISAYYELFRCFQLVKLFTDGGYEVRIYKVR